MLAWHREGPVPLLQSRKAPVRPATMRAAKLPQAARPAHDSEPRAVRPRIDSAAHGAISDEQRASDQKRCRASDAPASLALREDDDLAHGPALFEGIEGFVHVFEGDSAGQQAIDGQAAAAIEVDIAGNVTHRHARTHVASL